MTEPVRNELTIGFLGTRSMEINRATEIIEQYINRNIESSDDTVCFIFPLSGANTEEFAGFVDDLVKMARASEIYYELIADTAAQDDLHFTELAKGARNVHCVGDAGDVPARMEELLTAAHTTLTRRRAVPDVEGGAKGSALMVSWEGNESELAVVLEGFTRKRVKMVDLRRDWYPPPRRRVDLFPPDDEATDIYEELIDMRDSRRAFFGFEQDFAE